MSLATDPPGGPQQGIAAGRRDQRPGTVIASRARVRIELMASCAPRARAGCDMANASPLLIVDSQSHGCKVTNALPGRLARAAVRVASGTCPGLSAVTGRSNPSPRG
jgi:hypothetical protein